MFTNQRHWLTAIRISWFSVLAAIAVCAVMVHFALIVLLIPIAAFGLIANRMFTKFVAESKSRVEQDRRHLDEQARHLAAHELAGRVLKKSEEKFRNAFDHASIGMALVSMSGEVLRTNRALATLLGEKPPAIVGRQFTELIAADEIGHHNRELTKLFYGAVKSTQIQMRMVRSDEKPVWVTWSASLIPADTTDAAHYIFQFQDITDQKRAETQLAHDSLHDGLTGLPNRMLFLDRLQVAFRRAQRGFNINFAVCYLDLDQFKLVNDSLGHDAGDGLLIEIARRLKDVLRSSDTVARLGGDEFAILIEEIADLEEVVLTIGRIREELAKPVLIGGKNIYSTASIGITPWSRNYEKPDLLLRDADTALYQAKRAGRDRYEFFSEEMHISARESLEAESDLRKAVEARQFVPFYQPIMVLRTGQLAGFEALVRWDHPRRGLVSPAEFIPLAESTGLISPIGEMMLRAACSQMCIWQNLYPEAADLWVSVNVSARQFTQVDLVELIKSVLEETHLPARSLKLELTESAMAENIEHVVDVMTKLKTIGVRLSIDDFGTGYSSLSNLHRLPLNSLKIDRAFVTQMQHTGEGDEIVKTIVSLARSLELAVIAEGVENAEQLERLKELECQMGQGYYFSRPLDASAAAGFLLRQQQTGRVPPHSPDAAVLPSAAHV